MVFIACLSQGLSKYIKFRCRPLAFTSCKTSLKNKKTPGTSLPISLLPDFWRKIVLLLYYSKWSNFIFWLLLLREILGNMCIIIICLPSWDFINFEINFYNRAVLSTWPKSKDKDLNMLGTKRAFKMKQKAFLIIFKGLSLKRKKLFWKMRVRL